MKKIIAFYLLLLSLPAMAQFESGTMTVGYNASANIRTLASSGDLTVLNLTNRFQLGYFFAPNFSVGMSVGFAHYSFRLKSQGGEDRGRLTSPFIGIIPRYYIPLNDYSRLFIQGSYERGTNLGYSKTSSPNANQNREESVSGGYYIVYGGGLGIQANLSKRLSLELMGEYFKQDYKVGKFSTSAFGFYDLSRLFILRVGVSMLLNGTQSAAKSE